MIRHGTPGCILAILLTACDQQVPSATPASRPAPLAKGPAQDADLPAPTIMRLSSANPPQGLDSDAELPRFASKVEYAGPKTQLRVDAWAWLEGKGLGGGEGSRSIDLPLNGVAAFGFTEGPDASGLHRVNMIQLFTEGSGHTRSTTGFAVPSIKAKSITTYEPVWPLEVPDGELAIVWAVFVNEPEQSPEDMDVEERALRAEAAWVFKVGTGTN